MNAQNNPSSMNSSSAGASSTSSENSKMGRKRKFNWKVIVGVIVLVLVTVGAAAGFYIVQYGNLDLRQQAAVTGGGGGGPSGNQCPYTCRSSCGAGEVPTSASFTCSSGGVCCKPDGSGTNEPECSGSRIQQTSDNFCGPVDTCGDCQRRIAYNRDRITGKVCSSVCAVDQNCPSCTIDCWVQSGTTCSSVKRKPSECQYTSKTACESGIPRPVSLNSCTDTCTNANGGCTCTAEGCIRVAGTLVQQGQNCGGVTQCYAPNADRTACVSASGAACSDSLAKSTRVECENTLPISCWTVLSNNTCASSLLAISACHAIDISFRSESACQTYLNDLGGSQTCDNTTAEWSGSGKRPGEQCCGGGAYECGISGHCVNDNGETVESNTIGVCADLGTGGGGSGIGNDIPGGDGNDCSNVTGRVYQGFTATGGSEYLLQCYGSFNFTMVTNQTTGGQATGVCQTLCQGDPSWQCLPSSADCSAGGAGQGRHCNEFGQWVGPVNMHACGYTGGISCQGQPDGVRVFDGCNSTSCGNGGFENCYRTCQGGQISGSRTCVCEPNLSCGQSRGTTPTPTPGTGGGGTTPPPTTTPTYSCGSPCTSDGQCQSGDASLTCISGTCQNPNYPGAPNCQPPAGPMCLNITMKDAQGSPVSQPSLGQTVNFECGAVSGADHYIFRVVEPDGNILDLTANGRNSSNYTIDQAGTYHAQCQICTGADASSCHSYEPLN